MAVRLWAYDPDICDGDFCPNDCEYCSKAYNRDEKEEEEDEPD